MKTKMIAIVVFAFLLTSKMQANAGESVPANMALIPAGLFQMGDTFNEGLSSERPVHSIYLTAFYMDKYEVTKTFWDDIKTWGTSNGYVFVDIPIFSSDLPIRVNWYEALKWCNARSEKEGRVPAYYTSSAQTTVYRTGNLNIQNSWVKWNAGYRLPTEAEWEKAARGGLAGHRFSWSDVETITHSQANYFSSANYTYDVSPTRGYHPDFFYNLKSNPSPVGYFEPNGYGLYDMTGNVWEWCWDWWSGSYYNSSPSIDPRGPSSGTYRVLRGGGYEPYAFNCRVACRDYRAPNNGNASLGFRSVLPSGFPDPVEVIATVSMTQETYSCDITRQSGKDSLVVITHGWIPKKDGDTVPPNPDWIDDMAGRVRNHVANNWQVETFEWKEKAWMTKTGIATDKILENGEKEGVNLGNCLANQGWSHIHLIGHSAGAAVIQAATLIIKSANVNTVVHTTFLDPYIGFGYGGKAKYGLAANWADNYFAWDLETFDGILGKTASKLDHAYNVDVAWLDSKKVALGRYRSTENGGIEECFETVTSHGWPHDFYFYTVPPIIVQLDSQGFGFPLSKEGGGWDFALANYSSYMDPVRVLGTPDTPCFLGHDLSTPTYPPWLMNFSQALSTRSVSGVIQNSGNGLIITSALQPQQQSPWTTQKTVTTTAEPVWIVASIVVTNPVNFISFDAEFLSVNAEGLLTVYWETNAIGSIDERVVLPGLQHYTYSLPAVATNGSHTLGFRLDSFSSVIPSVVITNVFVGFVGISDPFSLSLTGKDENGFNLLKLTGPSGFDYAVETSTNLIDWKVMAVLVNTNGAVPFVDKQSSNSPARFYRAVGY